MGLDSDSATTGTRHESRGPRKEVRGYLGDDSGERSDGNLLSSMNGRCSACPCALGVHVFILSSVLVYPCVHERKDSTCCRGSLQLVSEPCD